MPPATFVKGASLVAREATFDPLRGAFVILARPNDPELNLPEPRRGLGAMGLYKDPGLVKDVLVRDKGRRDGGRVYTWYRHASMEEQSGCTIDARMGDVKRSRLVFVHFVLPAVGCFLHLKQQRRLCTMNDFPEILDELQLPHPCRCLRLFSLRQKEGNLSSYRRCISEDLPRGLA